MATAIAENPVQSIRQVDVIRRVNALRSPDNVTNWFYLVREYAYLTSVIGGTLLFYWWHAELGLASELWNIPVTLIAITLIGAGQHRLTTLSHEASHYMLFRNRLLNEVISDLFTMFPMLSTTHHYRLQHLAHHQFPNDPERDPDITQMSASGHLFHFPMRAARFVWECVVKQGLWIPNLIRYIRIRAQYNATGGGAGPYEAKGPRSKLLVRVGILYLLTLAATLVTLFYLTPPIYLLIVPACLLAAVLTFYALAPDRLYRQTNLKADITPRWATYLRVSYLTVLLTGLAWLSHVTGKPWGWYYLLLWLAPMVTSFSFFMIMRQVVQHGNADQGRYTNTRIFLVSRFIRFAVFPLGMDYHLPHHLFPMVPHFNLKKLHALLLETEEYRSQATVVEGYFFHNHPPVHPTVVELMSR
jgi:fatty acid desaturase